MFLHCLSELHGMITYCLLLIFIAAVFFAMLAELLSVFNSHEAVPMLFYKDSALAQHIKRHCPRLLKPLRIPFIARSPYVQIILSMTVPKPFFEFDRTYLELKDGGTIALDWGVSGRTQLRKSSPVLLILPGIISGAEGYTFLCRRAVRNGFRIVVFNKRGHGGSPLTTPKLQSFGDPTDLRQVIKYVKTTFPSAKIIAVGYSFGANLLLSYLGEYGSSAHVTAGVCISPTYAAEPLFTGGLSKCCEWILLLFLKLTLSRHAVALSKVIDIDKVFKSNSLEAFEENLYNGLYGYKDMIHYWERNCPMRDVDEVSIPLLCINSMDDPLCKKECIPFDLFGGIPNFLLAACERGGHGGFLHGHHLEPWADKLALDYLSVVLEFLKNHE